MEVILLERIEKLGQMGDIVTVKSGYARNFLLPGNKAVRATEGSKAEYEAKRSQLEAENLSQRKEAEAVAAKMGDVSIVLVRQAGESGQLYGSVNARDIAEGVTAEGFTVGRDQVILATPIKNLGLHTVTVALHPEVSVSVTVNVARSVDEAKLQAETGETAKSQNELDEEADSAEQLAAEEAAAAAAVEEQAEEMFDEGAAPTENSDEDASEDK